MVIHQVSASSVLKHESCGEREKNAAKHLLAFCQALGQASQGSGRAAKPGGCNQSGDQAGHSGKLPS